MKLTEVHLSNDKLIKWINYIDETCECFRTSMEKDFLFCLLELKQRRAEDRQREAENGKE